MKGFGVLRHGHLRFTVCTFTWRGRIMKHNECLAIKPFDSKRCILLEYFGITTFEKMFESG